MYVRVLRRVPDMLESFAERATELLSDRNHAVVLAGVTLMLDISITHPSAIEAYRPQVPQLCKILRSLIMASNSPGDAVLRAALCWLRWCAEQQAHLSDTCT